MNKKLFFIYPFYIPAVLVFLELTLRIVLFNGKSPILLPVIFSFSFGAFAAAIFYLIKNKNAKKVLITLFLFAVSLFYFTELCLHRSFGYFYPPHTIIHMAEDITKNFGMSVVSTFISLFFFFLLFLSPATINLFICYPDGKGMFSRLKTSFLLILIAVILGFTALINIFADREKTYIFTNDLDYDMCAKEFGILTATAKSFIPYQPSEICEITFFNYNNTVSSNNTDKENVLDIDFQKLTENENDTDMLALHRYYSAAVPSQKNSYTGLFKDKNLIFICAEAFSPYCISSELTPTLFKYSSNGFIFENYFTPSFGESTSGGEYALLTSQVPGRFNGEIGLSMNLMGKSNALYTLPALFSASGYKSRGYHNNSYTYYSRDLSHPKMLMDWYGVGGCVTSDKNDAFDIGASLSNGWPRSDKELIDATYTHYSKGPHPFFVYYLTVSGHNNYSCTENLQAKNNYHIYSGIAASERIKAYFSCQYELEKALATLENRLMKDDIYKDTVIVISNDHFPYGLSKNWAGNGNTDYLYELTKGKSSDPFEKERGALLIYSPSLKQSVKITKPISSFDVAPTLLNLFGIEYDSRFFVGRDALGNEKGLVFLSDGSFICDDIKYYRSENKLISASDNADALLKDIQSVIRDKIRFSAKARKKEYFRSIIPFLSHSSTPSQ